MVKSFASVLKEAREKAGLNQIELAQRVGLTGSYISILEAGKKPPPTDKIIKKLARVLGLETEDLLRVAHLERTPLDIKETVQQLLIKPGMTKKIGGYLQELFALPGSIATAADSSKGVFKKAFRYRLTHPEKPASSAQHYQIPVFDEVPDISNNRISGKSVSWHVVSATEWGPRRYGLIIKKDEDLYPKIEQNDLLIIDAVLEPKNSDFILAEVDNQFSIRRFYQLPKDEFELLPINPDLPPKRFSKDKKEIIKGVVVQIIRDLRK